MYSHDNLYSNPFDSAIPLNNECGEFFDQVHTVWDGAMPTQLSQDKVDLYRVEVVVDMILLEESNAIESLLPFELTTNTCIKCVFIVTWIYR